MKKGLIAIIVLLFSMGWVHAQVGVGTVNPNNSAELEISSTTKGLLVPRLSQLQRNAIVSPVTGLLVYQTDNPSGFYYYTGSIWVMLTTASGGWNLAGTSGTNSSTNYIGTSDSQSMVIKSNNTERIRLDNTGKVGINSSSPNVSFDISGALGLRPTTNAVLTGNVNNYNIGSGTFFRISSTVNVDITGIAGGYDGKILVITNFGSNRIYYLEEDSGSLPQNRIICSTNLNYDISLANQTLMMIYDGASQRWRIIRDRD